MCFGASHGYLKASLTKKSDKSFGGGDFSDAGVPSVEVRHVHSELMGLVATDKAVLTLSFAVSSVDATM